MAEDGAATDGWPRIVDEDEVRRLYFGPKHLQSEMRLADPWSLQLKYTQRMMAFLLFRPRPKHIVIAGLGGGSLSKFCWRQLPQARITTLEIDPRVIALAPRFELPLADPRLRIVEADACRWFEQNEERYDVVLLDGYDDEGVAGGFADAGFYAAIRARLRPGGVLAANLLVGAEAMRRYQRVIGEAFGGRTMVQRVVPDGNKVLFAFDQLPPVIDWVALAQDAKRLRERHGLDFPAYARALRRAQEREADDLEAEAENLRLLG